MYIKPTTSSTSQSVSSQKLPSSLPTQMSLEEQSYQQKHQSILQYQQQHPQSLPPSSTIGQQQRTFFSRKHSKNFYGGCTTTSTVATNYRMAASEHDKQIQTRFTGTYDNPKEEVRFVFEVRKFIRKTDLKIRSFI